VVIANVSVPQARASPSQRVEFCILFIILSFVTLQFVVETD
jgi:hypothetical protein